MKVAIIGRTEILYDTALHLQKTGHKVVCILTAKEAPEYTRTAEDFRALSEALDIPFAQGSKIIEHKDFLRDASADVAVSINYSGVLPQSVIDLFPIGVLNAHGGDLPRYRGNACQAWAILNGEERIGLCIHKMIGGELDSGDIIARDYLTIDYNTKITKVVQWMHDRIPDLMLSALDELSTNPNFILKQQSKEPQDALRCYPRSPEDGRIDWSKPAIEVLRLINASNKPYAGAFCDFEGKKLIIWDAELVEDNEIFYAVPGQVTAISDGSIEVAASTGKLRILSVEHQQEISSPDMLITSVRKRLT